MASKHNTKGPGKGNKDLRDSAHDRERLQPEETIINLPEVKDIPGQEHIHPPNIREMQDTTISSSDEEGTGVLDEPGEELVSGETNVSAAEADLLASAADTLPTRDQRSLDRSKLDDADDEGEPLNVTEDLSGSDLDVPGSEEDDENEEIGEEDEENNLYSNRDERE